MRLQEPGKTELVVETISKYLKQKKKICFAIARRQVVLELQERLSGIFRNANVIAVCGGHTSVLDGDLIICTTHQLYRYYQAFDCLILDEPDAFPFRGNAALHGIAETACRGHCVYLTATPDAQLKQMVTQGTLKEICLNRRPHGHDLPVPTVKMGPLFLQLIYLLFWIREHKSHPRMIFVPTIPTAHVIGTLISRMFHGVWCTSKTENRDEIIEAFRKQNNGIIVATTILERGVTVPRADVFVFAADHSVYDEAGLVQMAGRAGRSYQYPEGDVMFTVSGKNRNVDECCRCIKEANQCTV